MLIPTKSEVWFDANYKKLLQAMMEKMSAHTVHCRDAVCRATE